MLRQGRAGGQGGGLAALTWQNSKPRQLPRTCKQSCYCAHAGTTSAGELNVGFLSVHTLFLCLPNFNEGQERPAHLG